MDAGFAIECAAPHYYYGVALHQHVKATQDVFGCSSMDKGLEIGKDKSSERIGPVSSKETEDNQDDALARAWESIEVAKLCYENDGPEKHRDALAGDCYPQTISRACSFVAFELCNRCLILFLCNSFVISDANWNQYILNLSGVSGFTDVDLILHLSIAANYRCIRISCRYLHRNRKICCWERRTVQSN